MRTQSYRKGRREDQHNLTIHLSVDLFLAMSSEQAASVPAAEFKKLSAADKRAQLSAVDLWPVESVGKDKGGAVCLAGTHHPSKTAVLNVPISDKTFHSTALWWFPFTGDATDTQR